MTTHHTEEEEGQLQHQQKIDHNDLLFLRKRDDMIVQSGSRERMRSKEDSAKIIEGQRKQLEKHVKRLAMTKVKREYEQKIEMVRPGSGLNWVNQITLPVTPNLTGIKNTTNYGGIKRS